MQSLVLSEGHKFQAQKEEGIHKVLKEIGIEWKGVRDIAQNNERLKALCKPVTPTSRDSTK